MSVQEIIEQIKDLGRQEREQVRDALNAVEAETEVSRIASASPPATGSVWVEAARRSHLQDDGDVDEEAERREAQRRAAVWESLEWGFCRTAGRPLTEGIDEALYGPGA